MSIGYENKEFINKEARGFTWKHAAWFLCSVIMIEATIVSGFYSIKADMEHTKDQEAFDRSQISLQRVDIDLLKIQVARLQAQQESIINKNN